MGPERFIGGRNVESVWLTHLFSVRGVHGTGAQIRKQSQKLEPERNRCANDGNAAEFSAKKGKSGARDTARSD